jgi:hypothetical protein
MTKVSENDTPSYSVSSHTESKRAEAALLPVSILWDVDPGREISRWTTDVPLLCCAISPNGRRAIAGDTTGQLHWLRVDL